MPRLLVQRLSKRTTATLRLRLTSISNPLILRSPAFRPSIQHRRRRLRSPHAMFSTKLARATPRATAAISNSTTGAQQTTRCLATRPTPHQRRQSSSKASCPPDNPSKPAPAAKAIAGEEEPRSPVPAQKSAKGRSRGGYRRVNATGESKKAAIAEPVDQFAGLPSVPTIQNLDIKGKLPAYRHWSRD